MGHNLHDEATQICPYASRTGKMQNALLGDGTNDQMRH